MDWLWTILAIGVMGLLAWVGFRIEPHWSSKDGRRFLCSGQLLSTRGEPLGRWRETNVSITADGSFHIEQKRMMLRRHGSTWTMGLLSLQSGKRSKRRPSRWAFRPFPVLRTH